MLVSPFVLYKNVCFGRAAQVTACATALPHLGGWGLRRTNNSSAAEPKVAFLGESFILADMSTRSLEASLLNSASKVVRKGLRDIGLLPELERLALAGEGKAGEAALLRNGLLEERLSVRPGEGRRSVDKKMLSAVSGFVTAQARVKQAMDGALPGIDGSANMMLPLFTTLSARPIKSVGTGAAGSNCWLVTRALCNPDPARPASGSSKKGAPVGLAVLMEGMDPGAVRGATGGGATGNGRDGRPVVYAGVW